VKEIRGESNGAGRRFAVVAAAFNEVVVHKLVDGAQAAFRRHGVAEDDLLLVWVPGAFELPLVAVELATTGEYDAVVCLGAVVRGETAHFDFVAGEAARGVAKVSRETKVPVLFGVLTTETMQQALDRAGGEHGNKGWDAAVAAIQMASLLGELRGKP
jgi:6,7-dimethyl-8-ribityllumazine synthase